MKKETKEMKREKVKNGITELVFILDRSGSMGGLEADTIGGFNAMLKKQREQEGKCFVSTVLFDHETLVLHDRIPIADVKPMTEKDYQVRGCTALLDAVGGSIGYIERVQGYLPEGYRAEHVIFVITTDGMENASQKYTYSQVRSEIERKKADGWEFLFLGANIDAVGEAARIGISADRSATYLADGVGQLNMNETVAKATCAMRSAPHGERIDGSWKEPIVRDTAKRGGLFSHIAGGFRR